MPRGSGTARNTVFRFMRRPFESNGPRESIFRFSRNAVHAFSELPCPVLKCDCPAADSGGWSQADFFVRPFRHVGFARDQCRPGVSVVRSLDRFYDFASMEGIPPGRPRRADQKGVSRRRTDRDGLLAAGSYSKKDIENRTSRTGHWKQDFGEQQFGQQEFGERGCGARVGKSRRSAWTGCWNRFSRMLCILAI